MHSRMLNLSAVSIAAMLAVAAVPVRAQQAPPVQIGAMDLGGVVTGPNGPEAGVWVIAETKDLPTKFAKVVVTDDQGRYVIPDLPKGSYTVWARGYEVNDSAKATSEPGKLVNLTVMAASAKDAAQLYPGMYWYSMLHIPAKSEFPGTGIGKTGNGMQPFMKDQHDWVDLIKNACQSCHAIGSRGIREIPAMFKDMPSKDAWARRIQSGQAQEGMALAIGRVGPDKGLEYFADWTDRIAKGELPKSKPTRPQGVERNAVITMWDWSNPKNYLHDEVSTDKRNPTLNANGKIYGSVEEATNKLPILDPVANTATMIPVPMKDKAAPGSPEAAMSPSAYWGEEPIWDGNASLHNPMMDQDGRVWITQRIRKMDNPAWCKAGSDHPSAKLLPVPSSFRQLSMYDPKTQKWSLIDTCFSTHHLYFAQDANNMLWTSAGGPAATAIGWLNTKMYLETGDEQKSQGWTPLVLDANGDGTRGEYTEAPAPLDPTKDRRIIAGFYGVQVAPDGSIWGQAMDSGFSRLNQPGYLIRFTPGADPTTTGLGEVYLPPAPGFGSRGIDLDSKGVAWTVLSSGHLASFDRSKCKGPLNGPASVTGTHCPEGWTLYKFNGPQFDTLTAEEGSANHAYYIWVDRENTLGLGKDVPIANTNGAESLTALVDGKLVEIRVPYPMNFFSKNVDGRIDDANGGWKGRGLWTTSGTRANFHGEGGKDAYPKVFHFQMRPDPLAH